MNNDHIHSDSNPEDILENIQKSNQWFHMIDIVADTRRMFDTLDDNLNTHLYPWY